MKNLYLMLLTIFSLTSCAAPPPPACQQTAATSLQVYFDTQGTPFVMAGIETTAAAMLVDTGAQSTLVSHEIAEQAGLSQKIFDQTVTVEGMGGPTPAYITKIDQLVLGDAVANNTKIIALSKSTATEVFGTKTGIDGSLGNDIWPSYDLDLDFPAGAMTLYNKQSCATLPQSWPGKISAVPITIDYYGEVFVPVVIDGHAFTALLDTGTTVSILPLLPFESGLSSHASKPLKSIDVAGVGGFVPAKLFRFHEMTIGSEKIENPIIAVPTTVPVLDRGQILQQYFNSFSRFQSEWDVILGEDFIRTHRIFISYATHMLYIQN